VPHYNAANPFRVQWQLETRGNPGLRNEFCRSLITKKIEASILTLEKSIRRSDKWERAMKSAYAALTRLDENPFETITDLRILEANCAASYFRSWVGIPIKWRGTSRRPIPGNWHSIGQRSSPYHLAGNRNAAHPVNAILNYAYAALESEIRIKAISEGYDPTIGIMHEGSDGSSKFIFDLMEPERPKVDRAAGFRQGPRFRSGRFCHSSRRRLQAQSGNGAHGGGEGVDVVIPYDLTDYPPPSRKSEKGWIKRHHHQARGSPPRHL
jgi:CRISPR-associated endonuclease Cas1